MSGAHTPGPWAAMPRDNNMIDVIHSDRTPGAITRALCRVQARQSWVAEANANARLIAAAPDLLAALQAARGEIWRLLDAKGISPREARAWTEIVSADAAIAKATGEGA